MGDEVQVRREDQDNINLFSRLNQRETLLEDALKTKNKEKEDLDDLSTELELADEDSNVPYKIGDAFFHLPLEQAQELLAQSSTRLDEDTSELEDKLSVIREEMTELKVQLYARFGKSINLEK
ncbi:hypothetical protein Cpir12675_001797 [Ceratocystis pirilliformis]|uniref:Prefoldin subunit 4 n=1 Tax=Ceratocystis pirilliformis TaxID=259994 RepID=A0ABR3ZDD9_9PEZI